METYRVALRSLLRRRGQASGRRRRCRAPGPQVAPQRHRHGFDEPSGRGSCTHRTFPSGSSNPPPSPSQARRRAAPSSGRAGRSQRTSRPGAPQTQLNSALGALPRRSRLTCADRITGTATDLRGRRHKPDAASQPHVPASPVALSESHAADTRGRNPVRRSRSGDGPRDHGCRRKPPTPGRRRRRGLRNGVGQRGPQAGQRAPPRGPNKLGLSVRRLAGPRPITRRGAPVVERVGRCTAMARPGQSTSGQGEVVGDGKDASGPAVACCSLRW